MQEDIENLRTKEMGLEKQDVMDSFTFVKHKKRDVDMEVENVVHTMQQEKEHKKMAVCEGKEHLSQEGNAEQGLTMVSLETSANDDPHTFFTPGSCDQPHHKQWDNNPLKGQLRLGLESWILYL